MWLLSLRMFVTMDSRSLTGLQQYNDRESGCLRRTFALWNRKWPSLGRNMSSS